MTPKKWWALVPLLLFAVLLTTVEPEDLGEPPGFAEVAGMEQYYSSSIIGDGEGPIFGTLFGVDAVWDDPNRPSTVQVLGTGRELRPQTFNVDLPREMHLQPGDVIRVTIQIIRE